MCVRTYHCGQLSYTTAQNSSDNFPSYPPDNRSVEGQGPSLEIVRNYLLKKLVLKSQVQLTDMSDLRHLKL